MLNIIISGIIPRDESSSVNRIDIKDVNTMLKERCQDKGFQFIDQDNRWTLDNGELSPGLYYSDKIHLLEKGNKILAEQIHSYIYSIPSVSDDAKSNIFDENGFPSLPSSLNETHHIINHINTSFWLQKPLSISSSLSFGPLPSPQKSSQFPSTGTLSSK